MRATGNWIGMGMVALLAAGACGGDREGGPAGSADGPGANASAAAPAPPEDTAAARLKIAARADSVRMAFRKGRAMTREERRELRRDVNAEQIATARNLGVRASGEEEIARLRREGRLVALEDSTRWWILRDLDYSVPFVTPDTKEMLTEIGRHFHARMDSLGLPRYRMQVTSVLRTPETQADLRKANSNASQTVSAHEFGTTLDVSHVRFAAPDPAALATSSPAMQTEEIALLEEEAKTNAVVLQAELGRVLAKMRDEGKLRVMMERRQPVYHMTVARRF
jgi:hypothetical protein